jgi:hypothetical protein
MSRVARYAAVALLVVAACSRRSEGQAPSANPKPVEVAPPPGLVAELTIPDPKRFWGGLRRLGGSRAEMAPSSFELALFMVLDVPARVAGFVRPDTPVVGLVVVPPGAPPVLVLGVRTVRASELVQELTRPGAGYQSVPGSPITVLVGDSSRQVLGVVDEWLVASHSPVALTSAAPYLARGLGSRRLPDAPLTLEVTHAALAGLVASGLKERWATLRKGLGEKAHEAQAQLGRAPDFGDPDAVLALGDGAVSSLIELLGSTERLTVTLRPEEERLALRVELVPQPNGELARSVDALEVGSLEPLLGLPKSVVAVLSRSSEAERAAAAEKPADALRSVLGTRLTEKDAAPLADALRSFHRGRGSATLFGVLSGGSTFFQVEARDAKELERGIGGLLRMSRVAALAEPLEPFVGKLQTSEGPTRIAGIDGSALRLGLGQLGPRRQPGELLVHVHGKAAYGVLDNRARDGLLSLMSPVETLGTVPGIEKLVEGRTPSTLAVYADVRPLMAAGKPSRETAPALAVVGRRDHEALLEMVLSAPACAALLEGFGTP